MVWVAWRQFRAQAVTAAIGVLLLGAWLLATGQGPADEYAAGLAGCSSSGCDQFMDGFVDQHQKALLALTLVVLVVPALLGLFWGAPLVARELDAGTHRPVWNQSVTRYRWLTVKLLLLGTCCALVAGLVLWWVDRWSTPIDDASQLDPRLPMGVPSINKDITPCLDLIASKGYRQESTYHLPSQFWRLQWTEAALYTGATAGLVAFCFWWLRRRVV
jgi:hypothetical protein